MVRFEAQFLSTVKVRLSGNSSIGKVARAAYFHRAHYNSPMVLAAYFCRYPVSRGISRAVPKVSESSTSGAARTDQLTRRPRLVFSLQPLKLRIVGHRSLFRQNRSIGTPNSPTVPYKRTFSVIVSSAAFKSTGLIRI
jgi:hypothetical protein